MVNILNPHDDLEHHFVPLKNDLFFYTCRSFQVIFIHYKARIATVIRG